MAGERSRFRPEPLPFYLHAAIIKKARIQSLPEIKGYLAELGYQRSQSWLSRTIRGAIGEKPTVRSRRNTKPRIPLEDMRDSRAPTCSVCWRALSFDTDWLGRLVEWCPTGCMARTISGGNSA